MVDAKVAYNHVVRCMEWSQNKEGDALRWFFCFGTLEEYICDLTFSCDYDIDVGVLWEETNFKSLYRAFENDEFKVCHETVSDVDGTPLNVSFKAKDIDMPSVDVYLWYPKGNYLYHCFDEDRKRERRPERYTFRGIKREWICPPQDVIDAIRSSGPETDQILDSKGTWVYDIWEDHGVTKFKCPFMYGSLLDEWYPCWRHRQYNRNQSQSRWVQTVKSVRELK